MSFKIFISYRRSDTEGFAGRLYDRLEPTYSAKRLFIDVDSIPKGDDFVASMKEKVAEADVVVALIGQNWLEAKDERGQRRLDDAGDPVRIELEGALAGNKIIIPLLVGGAPMPRERQLPDTLKPIARRNAERLYHESFAADVKRLCASIERAVDHSQTRQSTTPARLEEPSNLDEPARRSVELPSRWETSNQPETEKFSEISRKIDRAAPLGTMASIVVGMVGSLISGLLLPRLGIAIGGGFIGVILSGAIGAAVLLQIARLARRA